MKRLNEPVSKCRTCHSRPGLTENRNEPSAGSLQKPIVDCVVLRSGQYVGNSVFRLSGFLFSDAELRKQALDGMGGGHERFDIENNLGDLTALCDTGTVGHDMARIRDVHRLI